MADTNTPNILLLLPDLGDTFNFALHVENNFSTIDSLMGAVQCTTTTRPSNTYAGQIIYETDSKRYVQNTGTKASPVWTYMSHAALAVTAATHPTSGRSIGELIYETDTTRLQAWNGSTWEQKAFANFVCTSSAHPASPFTGLEIFETDTTLNAVYNGASYQYAAQQIASTQNLSVAAASITFSGIPSSITNLSLWWSARDNFAGSGSDAMLLTFNGDSASHYGSNFLEGNGATVTGTVQGIGSFGFITIGRVPNTGATANYNGCGRADIMGWNKTSSFTTVTATSYVAAGGGASGQISGVYGGMYAVATSLTSVTIHPGNGSFIAGTEASLYAIP